jgi:hypothetical protein
MKTYKVTFKKSDMKFVSVAVNDITAENVDVTIMTYDEDEGRYFVIIATALGGVWERSEDVDGKTLYIVDDIPFEYLVKVESAEV